MEPVLVACDGCGARIRVNRPAEVRDRACPRCGTAIGMSLDHLVPSRAATVEAVATAPRRRLRWLVPTALGLTLVSAAFAAASRFGQPPDDDRPGKLVLSAHSKRVECQSDETETSAVCPQDIDTGESEPEIQSRHLCDDVLATLDEADPARACVEPAGPQAASRHDRKPPTPIRPSQPAGAQRAGRPIDPPRPAISAAPLPKRIRVRTSAGRTVVARVHGSDGDEVHVMLPDGQLGIPDGMTYTEDPFRPATHVEMAEDLLASPFADFHVKSTAHYLILYQSTEEFADESARVLESLYRGLAEAFRKFDVPVVDTEFPLVAVIFRTERDLRAHKRVDPEIQAFYELYTNRIYFYQTSDHDERAPEVAALRRPQTVAHEGTHQILQNIGIQPRLAAWPPWLVEGLAEYCSTPVTTRRGTTWGGLGYVNADHLATIRDLDDPLSGQVEGTVRPEHIGRPPKMPLVEYLVTKTDLTPTDYALAWGMTHYLAMRRVDGFVRYLKRMSMMPPLVTRTPADHLATFRAAFGSDLARLDREIGAYLGKLKVSQHLPYYAVLFEQRTGGGLVKRAAIVSQSPSLIRQWLETVTAARGETPVWEPLPYPSRTPALVTAQEWVRGS